MSNPDARSVLVGVDGSDVALAATRWATVEAQSRDIPMMLIGVIKSSHPSADDYYEDIHRAEAALRAARSAIEATGRQVKVESAVVAGQPAGVLIARSRDAELVCVGSVGIAGFARSILGSTAADLAEKAFCPVAVIRPSPGAAADAVPWILVAVKDSDSENVIDHAMREAELRRAPVLLLGGRARAAGPARDVERAAQMWRARYPDLHIYPIVGKPDVGWFMHRNDEPVALAVIGPADATEVPRILSAHGGASVLVVRGAGLTGGG